MANEDRIQDEVNKALQWFEQDALTGSDPVLVERIEAALAVPGATRGGHDGLPLRLEYAGIVLLLLLNFLAAISAHRRTEADLHATAVSEMKEIFETDEFVGDF